MCIRDRRKLGTIDNRGSHFWLARYWAEELAHQQADADLARGFERIARELVENQETIERELLQVQGQPVELGGYYRPEDEQAEPVMRPSATLNAIMDRLTAA